MKRKHSMASRRRGVTLLEVLIAAVLLAMSGVAVMNIFMGANRGIRKTDERREIRHHLVKIFAHANRQAIHKLFDNFGLPTAGAARPNGGYLARYDETTGALQIRPGMKDVDNPLGITQAFLDELRRDGLSARLRFDFFPRRELMEGGPNSTVLDTNIGLEYMQAGRLQVEIVSWENPEEAALMSWVQPVMCPMIVGRPGIALKSCPALDPAIQCSYAPALAGYEGDWNANTVYGC